MRDQNDVWHRFAYFEGRTAFQAALCKKSSFEMVQLLLAAYADVNAPVANYNGNTILQAKL